MKSTVEKNQTVPTGNDGTALRTTESELKKILCATRAGGFLFRALYQQGVFGKRGV